MKHNRYLFNCLTDPRRATRLVPDWWRKRIERNPGDLAYEYSVMNALATDASVEFIPTGYYYFSGFSDAKIEQINETCNAFVCPLADVFSNDFIFLVRRLTSLVQKLRIPCIVPCVGLRATEGEWSANVPDFDETVKAFVRAILEKSSKLGVRGETTGRYLEKLGFSCGRDFVVVGCPSMYTYGEVLPFSALQPPQSFERCAFSINHRASERDWQFIDGLANQFQESFFISQHWKIFRHFMLTNGRWTYNAVESRPVFKALLTKYAAEDRMRFFLNRKPWTDFLSTMNVSFGHRIHGALLSVLSGTPAVVVPFESRTEELARFHGIPMISSAFRDFSSDMSRFSVEEIFNDLDFSLPAKLQKDNFSNWISFLHANGLNTVFDHKDEEDCVNRDFPLENALPGKFPDDDMRAWRFNSPEVKVRMALAESSDLLRHLRGIPGRLKRKILSFTK